MGVVPTTRPEAIQFYEAHLGPWSTNALDIGLTVAEMGNMTSLTEAARASLLAANEARDASKAATQAYYTAVSAMRKTGSGLIETIRVFAEANNNPNVYNLAQIPPPAADTPLPPPGTPRDFIVELTFEGWLNIRWKCTNPVGGGGTAYEVQRKIGSGAFTFIGIAGGDKTFVDTTLPAGSTGVVYKFTGVRSSLRGPSAALMVNFGVGGGGGLTVTSVTEGGAKLAA